ncbi:MAG: putative ABC transporter permease [Eubacteriales bacterium]|nr:putative ABC transporter permease [Eubacteriales bacterium]
MIAGLSFYQIAWYFVLYSFVGWCVEVVFCTVTEGKVVNRGFLNGPVCPIYGFGMVAVLMILQNVPVHKAGDLSVFVLFLGSMLLATAVELVGGWLMLRLFHARWWDYRNKPFNIGGFVCLQFSILWGIGGVIVVRMVHPLLSQISAERIPSRIGWPVLAVLYAVYLADTIVTVLTVRGLNKDLEELDRVSASIRKVSDSLSEGLGTRAIYTDRKITEGRIQASLARAEARDAVHSAQETTRARFTEMQESAANVREAAADAFDNASDAAGSLLSSARSAAADAFDSASDAAGDLLSSARSAAADAFDNASDAADDTRAQLEKRAEALRDDILKKTWCGRRLLRAFPDMQHRDYKEIVEELQKCMCEEKDDQ